MDSILNNQSIIIMNKQSTQKQILHWNIQTFTHLTSIVDLVHRKEQKKPIHPQDYKLRDFYFRPNFTLFKYKDVPSFIEVSSEWIKHFASYNQLAYLQSISFEHQMEKHRFWNKVYDMYVKSKKDHENRMIVRNIVWTYRMIPIAFFLFGAATILKMTGISKMSPRKQIVGLLTATILGDFFVRARKSSDIFYFIPPLSDDKLQEQRVGILNKSIVLDGKINQVEFHPKYVNELIEEADKEESDQQRKLILQAVGYIVVDKVDFQY